MRRKTQGVRTNIARTRTTDVTKKKTWHNKYKCNELIYQISLSQIILRRDMNTNRMRE